VSDKYAFIAAERATHSSENSGDAPTMVRMCAWIGVSKSGYYEWLDRRPSAAARRRELLADKIRALFELVRRLMRELGLVPVQPRPFRTTTVPDPDAPDTVDLVRRDFTADRPGIKVVGDITYIRTWQGWLYLATLIDCFNREVIGWSIADHLRTELVTDALEMAVRNDRLEPDCILHSDRGTQYVSHTYRATLTDLGLRHSVGRTGQCWDNALAESFFASLKNERVHHMVYPTRTKAKEDIARYIELFYNQRRIHSALGYRTPHEVRTEYLNSQLAA
jgi:putative transposase